jgi:uncharacterized repeat protein (TIGR02543 family)
MKPMNLILLSVIGLLFATNTVLAAAINVSVGNGSGHPGNRNIEVPINVSDITGLGVISADIQLNYDTTRLSFASLTSAGTITETQESPTCNADTPGQLKIALFGKTALRGQGKLVKIYFNVHPSAPVGAAALTLIKTDFNEGALASTAQNSIFQVVIANRPPVIFPRIGNKTINAGSTLGFNISATDPDGDPLSYACRPLPRGAQLNPTSGLFNWTPAYTPAYNQTDSYFITFTVSDGEGGIAAESVTITVTYALTVHANNGKVIKNPNQAHYGRGTKVTLTAVPKAGYHFTGWSGGLSGKTNPAKITMNGNKTVTANFAMNTYRLITHALNGQVTKSPNQTNYKHGTGVKLTAIPNAGYHFAGWSGNLNSRANSPARVTMNGDKTVTANFSRNEKRSPKTNF